MGCARFKFFGASVPIRKTICDAPCMHPVLPAVMFYAPKFLALGGVQLKMLGSVAVMFWNFVTTLLAMFLVDKVGRRTLLLPSMFAMAISLLSMGPIYAGIHAGYVSSIWCFVPLFVFVTGAPPVPFRASQDTNKNCSSWSGSGG